MEYQVSPRTIPSLRRWDLDQWARQSVSWHPSCFVQGPNTYKYHGFKVSVNARGLNSDSKRSQFFPTLSSMERLLLSVLPKTITESLWTRSVPAKQVLKVFLSLKSVSQRSSTTNVLYLCYLEICHFLLRAIDVQTLVSHFIHIWQCCMQDTHFNSKFNEGILFKFCEPFSVYFDSRARSVFWLIGRKLKATCSLVL